MARSESCDSDGIPPIRSPRGIGRIAHAWARWRIRRAQEREAAHRRTPQARFDYLVRTAHEIAAINPLGLIDLVRVILLPLQSSYLLGVAEYDLFNGDELDWKEFFGPAISNRLYTPDGMALRGLELDPSDYPLSLARDPVLPWPWCHKSYISALATIGSRKESGGRCQGHWKQDEHHGVMLWLPWRIGFVTCGNHSIAAGIIAAEGQVVPDSVHDMRFLLDEVRCDGRFYRDARTSAVLAPMQGPRIGAVFEVGRLLAAQDLSSANHHAQQ